MRGCLMMADSEFGEKVRKDVNKIREDMIKQLQEDPDKDDSHNMLLEFLKKEQLERRDEKEILRDNYYKIMNEYDYWMDLRDDTKI